MWFACEVLANSMQLSVESPFDNVLEAKRRQLKPRRGTIEPDTPSVSDDEEHAFIAYAFLYPRKIAMLILEEEFWWNGQYNRSWSHDVVWLWLSLYEWPMNEIWIIGGLHYAISQFSVVILFSLFSPLSVLLLLEKKAHREERKRRVTIVVPSL